MKNIAYHVLDIAHNSIQAKSSLVKIIIVENTSNALLSLTIEDDGCGMNEEQVAAASDPYFTSRKTRHVGMGLALLKQNAEQAGGCFAIWSQLNSGTRVRAEFDTSNIDCPALGDIVGTIHSLITTVPDVDVFYKHEKDGRDFSIDTYELKEILEGVPLYHKEISLYVKEMIRENLEDIGVLAHKVVKHKE